MSRPKGKSILNPTWTPFERCFGVETPAGQTMMLPLGVKWLRNSRYQVIVRRLPDSYDFGAIFHLSIKRNDKLPIREWRDLQRIKNEVIGPEAEAIEVFPAESRKVDTANQYHLWVFPNYRFGALEIGNGTRQVETPPPEVGARQEPFDPGDPWGPSGP